MANKIIAPTGGDYTTLSAWEAALPATAAAVESAECANFALADNVAISGTVTSTAFYIRIFTQLANRHDGRSRAVSGTGFRISDSTGGGTIRHGTNSHVRYEGLEIEETGASNAFQAVNTMVAGSDIRVEKCIIHDTVTGTGCTIQVTASNLNLTFRNNVVYGSQRTWDTRGATSALAENNTFWQHADQLGLVSGSELTARNNYCGKASGTSESYWSGGAPTGNNNVSSDTTATARFTSSINSVAGSAVFTSLTAGAEDFRLKPGTNTLVDAGATLGTVTDDLIGTARPQGVSYDIGAFERISAGGTLTYSYTGTGGISLSGTATRTRGTVKTGTGGITIAGSAPQARGTVKTGSGGIALAGTAAQTRGRAFTGSGGLSLGGVASVFRGAMRAASGGISFAGSAAVSATSAFQARVVTPVGGFVLGGAAVIVRGVTRATSGGIALAGVAGVAIGYFGAAVGSFASLMRRGRRS